MSILVSRTRRIVTEGVPGAGPVVARRAIASVAVTALLCACTAGGPTPPGPSGAAVVQPALACMAAVSARLSAGVLAGGATSATGSVATSTWRNVPTASGTKKVVRCRADLEARRITSIMADGVELLDQPQPY